MTTYEVNKGINRSITYKGVKSQYIVYLAIGLVLLMLLFAGLYGLGCPVYGCVAVVIPCGGVLIGTVQHISKTYGEFGLLKKGAQKRLPPAIISRSRKVFIQLKSQC